jgi:hypothetical protein
MITEIRHEMVQKVATTAFISKEAKQEGLKKLRELDSTDKMALTEKYCEAADPSLEAKEKVWATLFSADMDKQSLYSLGEYCSGFR